MLRFKDNEAASDGFGARLRLARRVAAEALRSRARTARERTIGTKDQMAKIIYIEASGREHIVEALAGQTVMEAAVKHAVPGIDADCGGACACATCHVYIDPTWRSKTGERSSIEQSMLDFANNVEGNSRLACQIKVTAALDGLIVRMPKSQH
jgi:2Fe-2S ferredoxin